MSKESKLVHFVSPTRLLRVPQIHAAFPTIPLNRSKSIPFLPRVFFVVLRSAPPGLRADLPGSQDGGIISSTGGMSSGCDGTRWSSFEWARAARVSCARNLQAARARYLFMQHF